MLHLVTDHHTLTSITTNSLHFISQTHFAARKLKESIAVSVNVQLQEVTL